MRHLLPAAEADVLAEALLWQHPDVLAGVQGCQFAGLGAIEKYQSASPSSRRAAKRWPSV
jgi:hypothetical protein